MRYTLQVDPRPSRKSGRSANTVSVRRRDRAIGSLMRWWTFTQHQGRSMRLSVAQRRLPACGVEPAEIPRGVRGRRQHGVRLPSATHEPQAQQEVWAVEEEECKQYTLCRLADRTRSNTNSHYRSTRSREAGQVLLAPRKVGTMTLFPHYFSEEVVPPTGKIAAHLWAAL